MPDPAGPRRLRLELRPAEGREHSRAAPSGPRRGACALHHATKLTCNLPEAVVVLQGLHRVRPKAPARPPSPVGPWRSFSLWCRVRGAVKSDQSAAQPTWPAAASPPLPRYHSILGRQRPRQRVLKAHNPYFLPAAASSPGSIAGPLGRTAQNNGGKKKSGEYRTLGTGRRSSADNKLADPPRTR